MSDFTILVQGKLHPRLRQAYPAYQAIGPVVVSYWEGDDESILDGLDVVRVKSPVPDVTASFNNQNVLLQAVSTLEGALKVSTPYVIKVRTDESYTDLQPVVAAVLAETEKYTCLNVFVRAFKYYGVHPSDHLIGMRVGNIIAMFQQLLLHLRSWKHQTLDEIANTMSSNPYISVLDIKDYTFLKADGTHDRYGPPETMIGDAFLRVKGLNPQEATVEMMKENFQIVNHQSVGFINKHGDLGPYDSLMPEINSLDEL